VKIVAMTSDLMDRSRIAGAIGDVEFVADPARATGADVVVIDLARHADAVSAARAAAPDARIVGFGPHVDTERFARASEDGADVVVPRSVFFQDPAATLRP
jgi:DNA-binding NarL/FixJ family response regulator